MTVLFPGSRYATTPVVAPEAADGVARRVLQPRAVPPTPGVLEHLVVQGERLDQLAGRFYGDPKLYWLILDANPEVLDPFTLLTPGRRIRIPRDRTVGR
ncbi:LysM peptidoglycan-binding domain-containing protein [Solwaraspora sp. WMMB762]|uniref:LysM peptidoglycan-binding domain-containing protein n=1 Tax=Solwaraspora sp. WMMB762 TaxID=3404120 RepID=UPI003B93A2DD